VHANAQYFGIEKLPENLYPLKFKTIAQYQQQDKELLTIAKHKPHYTIKFFL
jgi:hypothetical protein